MTKQTMLCLIAALVAVPSCALEDTGPRVNELAQAVTMTQVIAPNTTDRVGADGVKVGPDGTVCTGWEQGGAITRAAADGSSFTTPTTNLGAEDCLIADIDGDGQLETVSGSESQWQIKIAGGGWTLVLKQATVPSMPKQRYAQLDWRDGVLYVGGRTGSTGLVGHLGYFTISGNPRLAASWTYHELTSVGWTMALRAVDVDLDGDTDVFYTSRDAPNRGVNVCDQVTTGQYSCTNIIPINGQATFGDLFDYDQDGDLDIAAGNKQTLTLYTQINSTWSPSANLKPADTGDLHGVLWCFGQIVTTYAMTDTGEYWLGMVDPITGDYNDLAGVAPVPRKPDQPACDATSVWFAEGGNKPLLSDDYGVGRIELDDLAAQGILDPSIFYGTAPVTVAR